MQTRACGKTGLSLAVLGFGAMRIHGADIEAGAAVVRAAAEAGINYFETSERYCNATSEPKVGLGLEGLRDRVVLSTKSAPRDNPTAGEVRRSIEQSLKRLRTDYLDFYQLWDTKLAEFTEIAAKPGGTLEGVRKAMDEGLIRHLGITTHDTPENMLRLIETGEFEAITIQHNLLNSTAEGVIDEAVRRGMGVVAMGPLHGGVLAGRSSFYDRLIEMGAGGSPVEIALRFVLTNSGVTCTISGMASVAEVEENRQAAERLRPLAKRELAEVEAAMEGFRAAAGKVCTLCEYCMPCPQDIWIPGVLTLANAARLLGLEEEARRRYAPWARGWADAGSEGAPCVECGQCVSRCPQGIDVPAQLRLAHKLLAPNG